MQLEDIVVEVRDRTLKRRGQIDARFLDGSVFSPRPNGVGTWQVTLPGSVDGESLEAALLLREKGSGIIVTGPHGVILSGPTSEPEGEATAEAPEGTWTISGFSDAVLLQDAISVPDPASADPEKQAFANDIRTAHVETLLRQYVSLNIANGAIARGGPVQWAQGHRLRGFRQRLRLHDQVDRARGPVRTKSPRYTNLLELCRDIVAGTDLLFDVQQVDDFLELVIWEAADLTGSHRMDIENDQLTSTRYSYSPPELTEAYVAGQGEGTERTVLVRSSPEAAAEEEAWGRPIERFLDQRQTDDQAELQEKVAATIADALAATDSLTVVPSDDLAGTYGLDWTAGARVTIVVGDDEVPARINQAVIAVTKEGVLLGCVIGDADGDWEGQTNRAIGGLSARVSSLERNGQQRRGSTAERDAMYGVPATDSARAALANSRPTWFNTDRGWEESYYAATGTPGLSAPGVVAGAPAAWYPNAGSFLACTRIQQNGFQWIAGGGAVPVTFSATPLVNVGGFTAVSANGIRLPMPGYYGAAGAVYFSGGGAMPYVACMLHESVGAGWRDLLSSRTPAQAADVQTAVSAQGILFPTAATITLSASAGAAHAIYGDGINRRTFLSLSYEGPPLVNR